MTRALSALGSVSASRSVRSGRFYCIIYGTNYNGWQFGMGSALIIMFGVYDYYSMATCDTHINDYIHN